MQYRAGKLVSGALHLTNQHKLEQELGWETIQGRAEILGLSVFYKAHFNMTRPLIRSCMTPPENKLTNLRNNGNKRQRHPYFGAKHAKSFFPYFTKLWNDLPQEQRHSDFIDFKNYLRLKYKPNKYKFYQTGCKQGNKLITRLRVDRSFFNTHSFSLGFSVSPQCDNCGARQENSQHLLLDCPKYNLIRKTMLDFVGTKISIFPKFCKRDKTKTLLYGYQPENLDYLSINRAITISVQTFLLKTQRFK